MAGWSGRFEQALTVALISRLGIDSGERDRDVAGAIIGALATRAVSIDRFFFDWRGGRDPGPERYPGEPFRALAALLQGRIQQKAHPYWSEDAPCSMLIDEVETIWTAIADGDDWQPLHNKVNAIRRMGEAVDARCTARLRIGRMWSKERAWARR